MSWFDRIKWYYEEELWTEQQVRNAVNKVITKKEYFEITGKNFSD